ncbi:MAG: phosphatidate cytidylyltransferase [Herpetosiphon sp.]
MQQNLVQRLASSAVLLPILGVVVWLGGWWVYLTVLCVVLLAVHELFALLRTGGYRPRSVGYIVASAAVLAAVTAALGRGDVLAPILTACVLVSIAFELSQHDGKTALPNWGVTLAGALYVAWLLAHFILLRGLPQGAQWVIWVLFLNIASDTGAYLIGGRWGRRRLAPSISPGKSWEGAIGGLAAAMAAAAVGVLLFGLPLSLPVAALLGAVGSAVGQVGDLSESLIKRRVGAKDSGHIIPGHGGILDRIDSLLFSGPVLYYAILWLTH